MSFLLVASQFLEWQYRAFWGLLLYEPSQLCCWDALCICVCVFLFHWTADGSDDWSFFESEGAPQQGKALAWAPQLHSPNHLWTPAWRINLGSYYKSSWYQQFIGWLTKPFSNWNSKWMIRFYFYNSVSPFIMLQMNTMHAVKTYDV